MRAIKQLSERPDLAMDDLIDENESKSYSENKGDIEVLQGLGMDDLIDESESKSFEDEVIRGKDAYGMEVMHVETGVTSVVVEDPGAGATSPMKRMRQVPAERASVMAKMQEQLVKVILSHPPAPYRIV